jgi:hypothetical protein
VCQRTSDAADLYRELTHCLAQFPSVRAGTSVQFPKAGPGSLFDTLKHMTMDTLDAASEPRHMLAILCVTLHLCPARDASVALSDLQDIREQQMRWCANAVQAGHGRSAGILGDCMLFHFEHGTDNLRNLQRAAALALDLCGQVQRRSRVLEVQHGVRLEISGGMHTATRQSRHDVHGNSHATNVALHLNGLAGSGVVTLSLDVHRVLTDSVAMETYAGAVPAPRPLFEPVYRLVAAPRT